MNELANSTNPKHRKRTLDQYFESSTNPNCRSNGNSSHEPATKKRRRNSPKKVQKYDSHLFTDDNPETTVHGTGFNSKEKAQRTITMMEGRDITYQFQVINTMYFRAKSVLKRTKNAMKQSSIQEAMDLFEVWLEDYRARNRKHEMMAHLKLPMMQNFEGLADRYGLDKSYFGLYQAIGGDPKRLRITAVSEEVLKGQRTMSWDIYRNRKLLEMVKEWKEQFDGKLYVDEQSEYKGLPNVVHTKMIMFGYSPADRRSLNQSVKILSSLR